MTMPGRSPQLAWLLELRSDVIAYRWDDAVRDFVPMFRGVVNQSEDEISPTVHTVTLSATDYRGVLSRQALRAPVTYTATEQSALVAGLVALGDQPAGYTGRLGLTPRTLNPDGTTLAATGVLQDRSYLRGQLVGSAIDDLSTDMPGGFNFSVDPDPANPVNAGIASIWYPHRGTPKTTWVAHWGSTVDSVARVVSTAAYASYALTIGSDAALYAESFGPGWNDPTDNPEGAWMTVDSRSDVSVQATLQQIPTASSPCMALSCPPTR